MIAYTYDNQYHIKEIPTLVDVKNLTTVFEHEGLTYQTANNGRFSASIIPFSLKLPFKTSRSLGREDIDEVAGWIGNSPITLQSKRVITKDLKPSFTQMNTIAREISRLLLVQVANGKGKSLSYATSTFTDSAIISHANANKVVFHLSASIWDAQKRVNIIHCSCKGMPLELVIELLQPNLVQVGDFLKPEILTLISST